MDHETIKNKMRKHQNDTGSSMQQIALLICKIHKINNHIAAKKYSQEDLEHMNDTAKMIITSDVSAKGNKKDYTAVRKIKQMSARIKKFLKYLKRSDIEQYNQVIEYTKEFNVDFIERYEKQSTKR